MNKDNEIKCINCNKSLFQKIDNKLKLRTNIVVFEKSIEDGFENSEAIIKCPFCKENNRVPIVLNIRIKDSEIGHYIFEDK